MKGIFYGVGVGSGDPELLTIKAIKTIEKGDIIIVPISRSGRTSQAYLSAKPYIRKSQKVVELLFPMSYDSDELQTQWDESVMIIQQYLEQGKKVVFLTIGDPSIYSTYVYVMKDIKQAGYLVEMIPGVPSFCAAAAKLCIPLGEWDEPIAIIPTAHDEEKFGQYFEQFNNLVLMKVSKHYDALLEQMKKYKMLDCSFMVTKCGYEDEEIITDLESKKGQKVNYLSTIIAKKGKNI